MGPPPLALGELLEDGGSQLHTVEVAARVLLSYFPEGGNTQQERERLSARLLPCLAKDLGRRVSR